MLICFNFTVNHGYSARINVPVDQASIQAAIDLAVDFDTIIVHEGTYFDTINFKGKKIIVASEFLLDGDTSHISRTIIDGDSLGTVVKFVSGEDSNSQLIGFTIRNGRGEQYGLNTPDWNVGGGIVCKQSKPILKYLNLIDNFATNMGGGIFMYDINDLVLEHIYARGNSSGVEGGAITFLGVTDATISNCIIEQNTSSSIGGGGIGIIQYSSIKIINSLLKDNMATEGAAIIVYRAKLDLLNNTIINNISDSGGAILFSESSSTSISNSIVYGNTPKQLSFSTTGIGTERKVFLSYSNLEDGTSVTTIGDLDSVIDNGNNINRYPKFIDTTNNNYQLAINSPCIDAGINDSVNFSTDLIGETRILDGDRNTSAIVDMGAYEFVLPANTYGTTIEVPTEVNTIQGAINISNDYDTILVAEGTYYENINFKGKKIVVASEFLLDGDTSHISRTIIDGDSLGTVVKFINEEDSTSQLIGFTIQNGRGENYSVDSGIDSTGGGIACIYSSPRLLNLTIKNNYAATNGGGIYIYNSPEIRMSNLNVRDNITELYGAGIKISHNSNVFISNSDISNNISVYGGGAIHSSANSNITLQNTLVYANRAWLGSAAMLQSAKLEAINSVIANNHSNVYGAVFIKRESDISVTNSIVWNNSQSQISVYDQYPEQNKLYFSNSNIEGGIEQISVNVNDSLIDLGGNVSYYPEFVDSVNNNYRLKINSPCIDAGINDSVNFSTDLIGETRILDGDNNSEVLVDMGAYEFVLPADTFGTTIEVPSEVSTIQGAINISNDYDTILVAIGTYYENIDFKGKKIVVASEFLNTGDTSYITSTIIDGSELGSVVKFVNEEDSTSKLIGFTIQNGNGEKHGLFGTGNDDKTLGGGIYCYYSSPILRNLKIINNTGTDQGGGIHLYYCKERWVVMENIIVENNTSVDDGGGIMIYNKSKAIIRNSKILNNSSFFGGGIKCAKFSSAMVENSLIAYNQATEGAAAHIYYSQFEILNSTIAYNLSTSHGAIYLVRDSDINFANSIIWGNIPQQISVNDRYEDTNHLILSHSNISGGIQGIQINDTDILTDAGGNINSDPMFTETFQLKPESPCIDAGINDSVNSVTDLKGELRIIDGDVDGNDIVDMGAYEYNPSCPPPTIVKQPDGIYTYAGSTDSIYVYTLIDDNTYQWQVNTGSSWTDLNNDSFYSGVTDNKIFLNNVPDESLYSFYRVMIYNDCDTVYTDSIVANSDSLFSVSGSVFAGNQHLTEVKVYIYNTKLPVDNNCIDSVSVVDGTFSFSDIAHGYYKLMCVPSGNQAYLYGPTYFVSNRKYEGADSVYLNGNAQNITIYLLPDLVNIDILNSEYVKIFPNPVNDILNIAIKKGNYTDIRLCMRNILGKTVLTETINTGENNAELNLSGFASGFYTINFETTDGTTAIFKVIKE